MSAWTKFATQFFHNKQKNDPDYKFSQALKQASPLFKKMKKGGSSKKQRGGVGEEVKKYKIENNAKVECLKTDPEYTNSEICKSSDEIDVDLTLSASNDQKDADMMKDPNDPDNIMEDPNDPNKIMEDHNDQSTLVKNDVKTGMVGGKKSKRKSKKAGKKSQKKQKKAKKAGSKKSKK